MKFIARSPSAASVASNVGAGWRVRAPYILETIRYLQFASLLFSSHIEERS